MHRLSGLEHTSVVIAQGLGGGRTAGGLAREGLVQGLSERVPQFLFVFAVQRNALRIGLPTLLQGFDGGHAQHGLGGQGLGLFDHGLAARQGLVLCRLQRRMRLVHQGFPLRLDGSKGFFAHVTTVAPALSKRMQLAGLLLPVLVVCVRQGPSTHLVHQGLALGLGLFGLLFDLLEPSVHPLVQLHASRVECLEQGRAWQSAVGGIGPLPLLAQTAQLFL